MKLFRGRSSFITFPAIAFGLAFIGNTFIGSDTIYSPNPTPKQEVKLASITSIITSTPVPSKTITQTPTQAIKGESGTVLKVVDGDTISVLLNNSQETIRIIGINTPETVDPRKPVQCFGEEASSHAKALLTGQSVQLESDPTQDNRDKYNRLLRYVWINNQDFGASMIADGYAYEYTYQIPYKYQSQYKSLQNQAETAKKGLWADDACQGKTSAGTSVSSSKSSSSQSTSNSSTGTGKHCSSFSTHAEAQAYFESTGGRPGNNVDGLDKDGDGIACESLP